MRLRRAADDIIDRSLIRLRLVIGLVAIVIASRALHQGGGIAAAVGLGAGIVIPCLALTERLLRKAIGTAPASAVMVAADTVITLVVLGLAGVAPGDPASLLLLLPLIEAGVRHGMFGVVITWMTIAFAIVGELAITWNGVAGQASEPMQFIAILIFVALPVANLSEHLSRRVQTYALARAAVDARAERLGDVLEASAVLTAAAPALRNDVIVQAGRRLSGGQASIVGEDRLDHDTLSALTDGDAVVAQQPDTSEAALYVHLGGSPAKALHCVVDAVPSAFAIEALELFCANVRSLGVFSTQPTLRQSALSAAPTGGEHSILDRRGINEWLESTLGLDDRSRLGVAVVELDNLNLLNDQHGRDVGDLLIHAVASRLNSAAPGARVGWLGGDEFVLAVDLASDLDLDAWRDALWATLDGSVHIGAAGSTLIHCGLGIAIADAADHVSGPQLLRSANEDMYADRQARSQAFLDHADAVLAATFDSGGVG